MAQDAIRIALRESESPISRDFSTRDHRPVHEAPTDVRARLKLGDHSFPGDDAPTGVDLRQKYLCPPIAGRRTTHQQITTDSNRHLHNLENRLV
jgi:hypothetical protein